MSVEEGIREPALHTATDDASKSQFTSTDSPAGEQFPSGGNVVGQHVKGRLTPFHPQWLFGFNKLLPVLNLSGPHRNLIFYTSSHVGVLYDFRSKEMEILQGHQNSLTSISADGSGRWLATADAGDDNVVIVWDVKQCLPIHTLFDPHPGGTNLVGLSPCASYLVTVSNQPRPSVAMWVWTAGEDTPHDTHVFDAAVSEIQRLTYSENKTNMFVLTSEKHVIFVTWENEKLLAHIPEAKTTKYLGSYTESVYQPCTHQVLTATSEGYVIVWSTEKYTAAYDPEHDSNFKHYVKAVRLQEESITVLTSVDVYVVTGDTCGRIKLYDRLLRMVFWWQNFCLDSLISISFQLNDAQLETEDHTSETVASDTHLTVCDASRNVGESPTDEDEDEDLSEEYGSIYKNMVSKDLALQRKDFIKDFIVSTASGHVYLVESCGSNHQIIVPGSEQHVSAVDVHPELPYLCLGNKAGRVWMYSYDSKHLLVSRNISENRGGVCCLKFAHNGLYLVCGMEDGCLWFLDSSLLSPVIDVPFQNTKAAITKICISRDSLFVAHQDANMCVSLYRCEDCVRHKWQYYGKQRSHYKPIRDILFGDHTCCMFSLGEDRTLVEYDVLHSEPNNLKIKNIERIEQSAVPYCMAWYPSNTGATEEFLITANNQYKYKVLQAATKMCYKTGACSLLGSPVSLLQVLPQNSPAEVPNRKYMLFATDKHIGVQMLPVDGNPYKAVAMIAHPRKIVNMLCTPDGQYAFALGSDDFSLLMWKINFSCVEVMLHIGGEGLEPYYCLVEGGRSGWFFNEMKDLFYYSQILHFGERKKTTRDLSHTIPLSVLPDLIRAVGYYPSEYEVENMIHEVKYSDYERTGTTREHVHFEDFVRLYLNHRPATGIMLQHIENTFSTIADHCDAVEPTIEKEKFISILKEKGEPFSQQEVVKYLSVLLQKPDRTESEACPDILGGVPEDIGYKNFAQDILGINSSISLGTNVKKPGNTCSKNDCNT